MILFSIWLENMNAIAFKLIPKPEGHGADNYESDEGDAYTLEAYVGSVPAGSLDVNIADTIHVRWIEVDPKFRRQGIGRALMAEIERRFPGLEIETGGFTDSGTSFWNSL
jgi:ribosomal protein S18 acetylase RimI-like enzyme